MSDDRRIPWATLLPELRHFPDVKSRAAALEAARKQVLRGRSGALLTSGATLLMALVVAACIIAARRLLGLSIAWIGGFAGVISWIVGLAVAHFALRQPLRRSLRRRLVAEGIPICIVCGYDLRGSPSGRCPECGAPISAPPQP